MGERLPLPGNELKIGLRGTSPMAWRPSPAQRILTHKELHCVVQVGFDRKLELRVSFQPRTIGEAGRCSRTRSVFVEHLIPIGERSTSP